MACMFANAKAFNQNLNWNISKKTDIYFMFGNMDSYDE